MLEIKGINQFYGESHTLWDLDLTVQSGSRTCLMGRNGVGKSTLLRCIMGLERVRSGSIRYNDEPLEGKGAQVRAPAGIAYVPQGREIFPRLTVDENLRIGLGVTGALSVPELIFDLFPVLAQMLNRRGGDLSGGQQQQLAIGRALVLEPTLLILDEPTAGVDIEIRRSMWEFLRNINAAGTTIILTTHYLEEAESLCRHVAIIDEGAIIEDAPMNRVLRTLQREVFVLSLEEPVSAAPELNGFDTQLRNDSEIEVDIGPGQNLNQLFEQLNKQGIQIDSLRNKTNRLEELFMRLVENKDS